MLSQRQWRTAGLLTIAACALLAWVGAHNNLFIGSPILCILCWGTFAVLMAITGLIVWLDIRFIRMQYAIERRTLFKETLGSEEFRKTLLNLQEKPEEDRSKH